MHALRRMWVPEHLCLPCLQKPRWYHSHGGGSLWRNLQLAFLHSPWCRNSLQMGTLSSMYSWRNSHLSSFMQRPCSQNLHTLSFLRATPVRAP